MRRVKTYRENFSWKAWFQCLVIWNPGLSLLPCLICLTCFCSAIHGDGLKDKLTLVREGYLANRFAYPYGKCRFRYNIRAAASEKDAIDGHWVESDVAATRVWDWYFTPGAYTLKPEYNAKNISVVMRMNQSIITPVTIARKGAYAIDHDALINTVVVHSPHHDSLLVRYNPFNMAHDGPGGDLGYLLSGVVSGVVKESSVSIDENASMNSHLYTRITIDADCNSDIIVVYVDESRGYLPFVQEGWGRSTGKLRTRNILTDFKEFDGVYFPMRAVNCVFCYPLGKQHFLVREMEVLDLDLSYHPTKEDLSVPIPGNAQYSDGVDPQTAKTLYRSQAKKFVSVSVDDIEDIYQDLQEVAKLRRKHESSMLAVHNIPSSSAADRRRRLYISLGLLNGLVLITLVAIYLRRKRRRMSDS